MATKNSFLRRTFWRWLSGRPIKMKDKYLQLAKKTVETYIKEGKIISPPENLPKEMLTKKAGVFVSLHLKDGSLRGCIGTFVPTKKNLVLEIMANAISSSTQDPRFPPVTEKELANLIYSVDVLSASKTISKDKLKEQENCQKYGLI